MKSTLLLAIAVFTTFASARSRDDGFDQWVASEQSIAVRSILQNVSPFDGLPGTVIASPEREAPDYYYHWVRDAALTMNTLFSLFEESPDHRSLLEQTFLDYNVLTRIQQKAHTRSGHGEPKFYVDGRGYDGDWCRPQNDGPALRAIVLTRIANHLRSHGQDALVRQNYYDAKIPTDSTIKADLEFVAHHWRETNCDLWEEVKGHHFYTRMVQRKALIVGAQLARDLGDPGAADFYLEQAAQIELAILSHWDPERGYFVATLDRQDGIDKPSGMDTSVILGVLHGHTDDGFLSYSDPRVLQTASRMEERFKGLYPINGNSSLDLGPAIGRYPEDIYGGAHFDGGNPWILLTAAFGQFYYRVGQETLTRTGNLEKVNSYLRHGDAYLNRVRYHASNEGKLDEQMDRYTGMLTSARDLTWSYAETLEALRAHDHLRAKVRAATAQNCPELLLN